MRAYEVFQQKNVVSDGVPVSDSMHVNAHYASSFKRLNNGWSRTYKLGLSHVLLGALVACSQVENHEHRSQREELQSPSEGERDPAAPDGWKGSAKPSPPLRPGRLQDGSEPLHPHEVIAAAAGIEPSRLQLLNESRVTLRYLGDTVTRYKYLDTATHVFSSLVLDDGANIIDYQALKKAEEETKYALMGTIYPPLHKQLIAAPSDEEISILIKMRVPQRELDRDSGDAQFLKKESAKIQQEVELHAKDLLRNAFSRLGVSRSIEDDVFIDGPFATLAVKASDALLLGWAEEIVFVGPYFDEDVEDTTGSWTNTDLDDALVVTRVDGTHTAGYEGDGVRLAVMETGQSDVPLSCFDVAARQTTSGSGNAHLTNSMLLWGNTDHNYNGSCTGSEVGYAPDAEILMANGGSSNTGSYASRYQWARENDVDVVSMSFHAKSEETDPDLHSRDIYFDYWTQQSPYPIVFTSAGNEADGAYASGKGYNILGVGNSVLDSTLANRCDDDMFDESSWKNPNTANDDRELPPIAAPGQRHRVYDRTFGGTSAATPVAAATAALLIDQVSALGTYPEAIRSILLAGANYQGGDGSNWRWYDSDDRDGVGLINSYYSRLIAATRETTTTKRFRAHDYGTMRAGDFSGSYFEKEWTVDNNDAPIRIAVTWDSKTTSSSSVLNLDLDLLLYDSNGWLVAWSQSDDSNYEFIEYTPPSGSGDYTIKFMATGIPSNLSTYYSVAWTVHYDCQ